MPISTDSTAWEDGEVIPTTEYLVLDFLKDNKESAYNIRELADEILGTDWTGLREQDEKRDELPEDEYLHDEERENYPYAAYYRETALLQLKIRSLIERGLVDFKAVNAEEFGIEFPDDYDQVAAYTYHQE